jgi:hypothetical protein
VRREHWRGVRERWEKARTNVFVLNVLKELELAISAFGEDRRAEGLHDLLDGNRCACELVFCGTEEEK